MNEQRLFCQGDVKIERVESIPEGLDKVEGPMILMRGEATGHAHILEGEAQQFLASDIQDLEESFIRVEAESTVSHDEHDTIAIPPGDYKVSRQIEHAPEAPVYAGD